MRKRPPTRAERLAAAERELARTLRATGVVAMRARGVRAQRPAIPDYDVSKPGLAPLSQCKGGNGFRPTKPMAAIPAGFHVGNSHKQGMAVFSNKEVEWSSGKKS